MSNALPLSSSPELEQYDRFAKDLQRAGGESALIHTCVTRWVKAAKVPAKQREAEVGRIEGNWGRLGAAGKLTEARRFVAHEHGFQSWLKFAGHLRALAMEESPVASFEAAADAIVRGDAAMLKRILARHPKLVRVRSNREHRSTLLHYVSANGIEDYRQKTPRKMVSVARLLLDSGSDVNAESDAYGGGSTALNLTATSCHPETAGVQIELLELLLDRGAEIQRGDVRSCLANGRGTAARFLAEHGVPLSYEEAAGVGRLDLLKTFTETGGDQQTRALDFACQFGHIDVIEFLLDQGAKSDMALHWAAWGPHVELVRLLLDRGAPLDVRDPEHDGTPLDWALYGQRCQPAKPYGDVIALLSERASRRPKRKAKR